jgi:tetratricopeptide (TPR) repeat protein
VFRDGWTLEAAEALCQKAEALEFLLQLRERSLITVEEIEDATRYRMLETVREYAAEQLSERERLAASRVHAEFFLSQAETAEAELVGPDAPVCLAALERDHPNFREALAFMLSAAVSAASRKRVRSRAPGWANSEFGGGALRMAAALWRFWYLHGHYDEGGDWLQKALDQTGGDPAICMKAWRGVGNLAYDCGKFDRAYTAYTNLLSLARQSGVASEEGAALGSLGNLALAQGDLKQARLMLEESLSLFRKCEHPRGTALVLANLALVTLDSGDPAGACALHRESLALFEQTHDTHNMALANNNLGHAALQAGDYSAAEEHLLTSFRLARTLGSPFLELYAAVNLASLLARLQEWRRAALLCGIIDNLMQEHRADLLPQASDCYQEERDRIEQTMGIEEFHHVWHQGQNMRIDQVEALMTGTHIAVLELTNTQPDTYKAVCPWADGLFCSQGR